MQVLINGLINGLVLGLLALAFNVVYLPTRVFFVAQAGIFVLTPYVAWQLHKSGMPFPLALILSGLSAVLVAVSTEVLNHRPLFRRNVSGGAHLVSSLGIYIVIVQAIVMIWGAESRILRQALAPTVHLGPVILTQHQLMSGVFSLLFLAAFAMWLKMSAYGLRLRALSDNPSQLALYGHNVPLLRLFAFALSGLLTAAGSILMANDVGFDPHGGLHTILLAIVAVIIGGRSSFMAPVVGALLLGVLRAEVVSTLSPSWAEAATFAALALVLLLRPHGIFAQSTRLEATA